MNIKPWKILQSSIVYDALPFLRIRKDVCELPNGRIVSDYNVLEESEVVMIFGLTADKQVILVRQYKHGIGEITLELPAGMSETTTGDYEHDARREFREETGYEAAEFRLMLTLINNPTRINSRTYVYMALDAVKTSEQEFDENEFIEVETVPLDEIRNYLYDGRIQGVGSVASILAALDTLKMP